MRAATSLYLPVLLILIFAGEQGGFKMRPVEHAQTVTPTVLADLSSQPPQKGTYALDDVDAGNDVQALYYEVSDGKLTQLCGPSAGSLEITRSEPDRIAGTFAFAAAGMAGQTGEGGEPFQVQISGSFEAQRGDARDLPAGLQLKR